MDELITINVRGRIFQTTSAAIKTLSHRKIEDALDSKSQFFTTDSTTYFFDRNPAVFEAVLDFHTTGKLHIPRNICGQLVREELNFWSVNESSIAPCCWRTFYSSDDTMSSVLEFGIEGVNEDGEMSGTEDERESLRQKIWIFLEEPMSSIPAQIWSVFYYLLLLTLFVIDCLETLTSFRDSTDPNQLNLVKTLNITNPKKLLQLSTKSFEEIHHMRTAIFIIFALEFLIRLFLCPDKKSFVKKPLNILEILVIPAMCADQILHFWTHSNSDEREKDIMTAYTVLNIIKHLRLLRFLRLQKQFPGLKVFLITLKASRLELLLFLICILISVSIASTFIYAAEFEEADTFGNMLVALWWAIITLTTVGYGDVYPVSLAGRIWGSICAIMGILIIAMPITLLAANFGDLYNLYKDKCRRKRSLVKAKNSEHSSTVHN